jgi:hypothetical protein
VRGAWSGISGRGSLAADGAAGRVLGAVGWWCWVVQRLVVGDDVALQQDGFQPLLMVNTDSGSHGDLEQRILYEIAECTSWAGA